MKPIHNIRKTAIWLGIVLPVFMLLVAIWVDRLTNGQFNASFDAVSHTYNVLNLIEQTQAHIADAETGRRGYILTGREDYARLRDASLTAVDGDIKQLEILVPSDVEKTILGQVQALVSNRLGNAASKLASTNLPAATLTVSLTDDGMDIMSKARSLLFQMRTQEAELLTKRQKNVEKHIIIEQTTFVILVAITAITLIAGFIVVLRFERLRQIVTVCAWTGQIKDGGEWVPMEEYLKKRFGVAVSHGVSREAAEKMVQESRQAATPKST